MGANADQKLDFGVTKTLKLLYSEPLHFYQHKFDAGYFKINLGNGYVVHVTKKMHHAKVEHHVRHQWFMTDTL